MTGTLPFDINYKAKKLISEKGDGIVNLDPAWGYRINERTFEKGVEPLLSEDYIRLGIEAPEDGIAYSGAESSPENPAEKRPNITVLRNWDKFPCSTMGHHQGVPELEYQEIYEYHGFGAMVIDRDAEKAIELHCMRPGDKVLIPSYCIMTLYNLDERPLLALDFANPMLNVSTKDLQKTILGEVEGRTVHVGPVLCMYFGDGSFNIRLNRHYVNRHDSHGVKVPEPEKKNLSLEFPLQTSQTKPEDTGLAVYEGILGKTDRLADLGIVVIKSNKTVSLDDLELSAPLWDMAEDASKPLHKYFRML